MTDLKEAMRAYWQSRREAWDREMKRRYQELCSEDFEARRARLQYMFYIVATCYTASPFCKQTTIGERLRRVHNDGGRRPATVLFRQRPDIVSGGRLLVCRFVV